MINLNLQSIRMHPLEECNIVDTTIDNNTTAANTITTTAPSITVNKTPASPTNNNTTANKTTTTPNANEIEMVSLNKTLLPS